MNIWKFTYTFENGMTGSVQVYAANRMAAYESFEDISKDFGCKIVELSLERLPQDEQREEEEEEEG